MKKQVIRMALAGALAFGVASVSKADEAASAPTFSVVAQELATQTFGTKSATSTTNNATAGDSLNTTLQHVILGTSYGIDSLDTLTVKAEAVGGFTLLDAYDTHSLADLNAGLSFKAGQLRIPFGADAYKSPDELIRTGYSSIDSLAPTGKVNDNGDQYDLAVELDQTYSDLTIQVAALQNGSGSAINATGNKDWAARAQWKSSNVSLGLSDYYQATSLGTVNNVNVFGANAGLNVDVFALDLEAIFGSGATNGYTATLSAKPVNGFQAAAWYEFTAFNYAPAASTTNGVQSNDLGAGVNFMLGAKTRLNLNVDFNGYNSTTGSNADLLAANTETLQLQEVF